METKTITSLSVKDAEKGLVTARFATLGVKDLDGDIIERGAIGAQAVKVSAYGHVSWGGVLPVGVGRTLERGEDAIAELQFFMNTTNGVDTFRTIKGLGSLAEFSFGFDVKDSAPPSKAQAAAGVRRVLKQLVVHEVSPVLRGAGINTGVLAVKCDACAAKVSGTRPVASVPTRAELEKTLQQLRDMDDTLRHLDGLSYGRSPETTRLARFASRVAHVLVGAPGGLHAAPEVRWFSQSDHPTFSGYMLPTDSSKTWVSFALEGRELCETAAHEAMHHKQAALGTIDFPSAEDEAAEFGRQWGAAIYAAARHTRSDAGLVIVRSGRPPFPDRQRALAVLSDGHAWTWNPFSTGNSWQREA